MLDLPPLNRLRRAKAMESHISPQLFASAKQLITAAGLHCNKEYPFYEDGSIFALLEHQDPIDSYDTVLKFLYYRGRLQSAVWDLFEILSERGLLDRNICLREYVNFVGSTPPTRAVYKILKCFEGVVREFEQRPPPFKDWIHTEAPLVWLAHMIARACADPNLVITEIQTTQILGKLRRNLYDSILHSHEPLSWTCDGNMGAGRSASYFGFWLPHGLGSDPLAFPQLIRKKIGAFNSIERVYKQWFDIPDTEICTEENQDTFLRQAPEREPRLKYSGHWHPEDAIVSPPLTPTAPEITSLMGRLG